MPFDDCSDDDDDDMSEEEEERWCAEQRGRAVDYLRRERVDFHEVGEWPAWHIAPYVSIWAVEPRPHPGWVGWWVICGDLPTDYCTATDPVHPRTAARHFSDSWFAAVNACNPGDKTIGDIGLPVELEPLLRSRAEFLADWAADDSLWRGPIALESPDDVREHIETHAVRIGAPPDLLPTYGRTADFARPHIEVDDHYHYVVVERGMELERFSTQDLDALLYRVFHSVTFSMAWKHELAHRRPGLDPRRLAFNKQEELMAALRLGWGAQLAAEHRAVLARRPFADDAPVDPLASDTAGGPVLSVILPARHAAPDLAALMRALVPGAVDGLVREVIVADPAPDADVAALCEDAGAVLVRGGLAEAAGRAKSDRVLVVPPTLRLPDAWMRRLGEALARGAQAGLLAGAGEPGLLAAFRPRPTAVLAPKTDAAASPDLAALRRRLGVRAKRL